MAENTTELLKGTLDLLIRARWSWSCSMASRSPSASLRRLAGRFRSNPGSLFPALHRLEQEGWIAGEWQQSAGARRVKAYALTRAAFVSSPNKWHVAAHRGRDEPGSRAPVMPLTSRLATASGGGDRRHRTRAVTRVRDEGLPHFLLYHLYAVDLSLVIKTRVLKRCAGDHARDRATRHGRAVFDVKPMTDYVAQSIGDTRFTLLVMLGFAAASLLLAGVGIYGTLANLISQRPGTRRPHGTRRRQVGSWP